MKLLLVINEANCSNSALARPLSGPAVAGSQNGRLSRPCAMGGNFGFRGEIGLSGLDLFGSFGGNAKKNKFISIHPKTQ